MDPESGIEILDGILLLLLSFLFRNISGSFDCSEVKRGIRLRSDPITRKFIGDAMNPECGMRNPESILGMKWHFYAPGLLSELIWS